MYKSTEKAIFVPRASVSFGHVARTGKREKIFARSNLTSFFVLAVAKNYQTYLKTEVLIHLALTRQENAGIKIRVT